MRLSQIPTHTLLDADLSRSEARAECRAGTLWASSPRDVAIAPDEAAARWALESDAVERVTCSTLPDEVLASFGRLAVSRSRSHRFRRTGRLEVDLPRGAITLPLILGETSPDEHTPSMSSYHDAADALAYATTQGAPSLWAQGSSTRDDAHISYPTTGPVPDWVRRFVEEL